MNKVKSEDTPAYNAGPVKSRAEAGDAIINQALEILAGRLTRPGEVLENPNATKQYLTLQLAAKEHEVFCCIFLDNRHRVIGFAEMFQGTIDGASIHPREVLKEVLKRNAAAVIFAHNHPSGLPEPSKADITITRKLTEALALIDIRVLDSMIVGGTECLSMAERGLI